MKPGGGKPQPDEACLRIDGGLAAFPGRARSRSVALAALAPAERARLMELAEAARFFECAPAAAPPRPDARTYVIRLIMAGRDRELRLSEPIADPALAELVAALRAVIDRY